MTALVNERAATMLRTGRMDGDGAADLAQLQQFLATPHAAPESVTGDLVPSFLGLIPTRGCNIGCVYCNFGGPTASMSHMDPGVAVAAVDWMARRLHEAGRRELRIHFFGGEPFASPDIVDIVVHRARYQAARYGLVPYIDASTNGVFGESRGRFVGDYLDGVVLSFDGFAEFHDRNRPAKGGGATFQKVESTARLLSTMPVDLCLRVCITAESVSSMEEMTRWMCSTFHPAVINFETLTPGELATKAGLRVPDPFDFAMNYMRAYRAATSAGVRCVYSAAETERARISFCPVGTDALIVSMDGRASACYLMPEDWTSRGLDLDLGWVRSGGEVELDFDKVMAARRLPLQKPRCAGCSCQWSCAGGCHVNQTYPGSGDTFTDFCAQTRIITACLLLQEIGAPDEADKLLSSRIAMEALANHAWDAVALPSAGHGTVAPARRHGPATPSRMERPRSLVAGGTALLG